LQSLLPPVVEYLVCPIAAKPLREFIFSSLKTEETKPRPLTLFKFLPLVTVIPAPS